MSKFSQTIRSKITATIGAALLSALFVGAAIGPATSATVPATSTQAQA